MDIGKIEQLTNDPPSPQRADIEYQRVINAWKPKGTCQKCQQRPATQAWSDEGLIAAIHGVRAFWCKPCVLRAQIEHARKMAAQIPELERELATLESATNDPAVVAPVDDATV